MSCLSFSIMSAFCLARSSGESGGCCVGVSKTTEAEDDSDGDTEEEVEVAGDADAVEAEDVEDMEDAVFGTDKGGMKSSLILAYVLVPTTPNPVVMSVPEQIIEYVHWNLLTASLVSMP